MPLPQLTGRQHAVAYLSDAGHFVVQGTAGSGKTVMAVVRAANLVNPATPNHGPTLLLTHDNSLVKYIRHLADGISHGLVIETFHKFARGYLASLGLMQWDCIAQDYVEVYLAEALAAVRVNHQNSKFFDRPKKFFLDEIEWIAGMGLSTEADYLAAERVGRVRPLREAQRKAVWSVMEKYVEVRTSYGKTYDWWTLAPALNKTLESNGDARVYRHIIVDEAQDLPPEAIRALAASIQDGGSLTLFVDESQQIYGQRTSWRSCGLNIHRVEPFTDNYRNSPQIAAVAIAIASMEHFKDSPDIVMPQSPQRAAGTKPTLYVAQTRQSELQQVRQVATALGRSSRVAVLAHTRAEARAAVNGISGARLLFKDMLAWDDSPGVFYGTYHAAKGLEFEAVLLPFASSTHLPDPDAVDAFGEEEALARESRLLYVGVTRARSELLVTCVGDLTVLLPDSRDPVWTLVVEQ